MLHKVPPVTSICINDNIEDIIQIKLFQFGYSKEKLVLNHKAYLEVTSS
ncbi:hypothetical protein JCM19029_05060 [Salinicoccus sesuvii]